MPKKYSELTQAEWTLMKAVWANEPTTAPHIQLKLAKVTGWTYSTVRTLLDRMVAKGLLRSEKAGKLTRYNSVITRATAQRNELLYTLKHAFNGALTPMVQSLLEGSNISNDDLVEIEALIRSKKKDKPE